MHRKRGWLPVVGFVGVIAGTLAWPIHVGRRVASLNAQLCRAVSAGDIPGVVQLLRQGADPNFQPSDLASMWQSVNRAVLINPKLWPSLVDDYRARMFEASPVLFCARDALMVRTLLAHGADPNREGTMAQTVLGQAAGYGNAAMVRALLAGGAKVNHRNRLGWTPLLQTAEALCWPPSPFSIADHHYADVISALIEAGAEVNAKTSRGKTALAIATRSGRMRYVELLKKAGAK